MKAPSFEIYSSFTTNFQTKMGCSGGAMVPGKLSEPGRPSKLDEIRASVYCTYSRCGVVRTFFLSSIFSLFFLPLSGRQPDTD